MCRSVKSFTESNYTHLVYSGFIEIIIASMDGDTPNIEA